MSIYSHGAAKIPSRLRVNQTQDKKSLAERK